MQRSNHFFATRAHGVDKSEENSAWRFGKGNIFSPSAEHPEFTNAKANAEAIMRGFFPDATNAGVILTSQYKKGICKVTSELLASNQYPKDQYGRTVVPADGLFTTETHIPLLNASGDAHAIVFEAKEAVGILVGSWRCLGKDILNNMLDCFKAEGINFTDINVHIGPGLGKDSYSIGLPTREDLINVFGQLATTAVTQKASSHGKEKFVFDVHSLMRGYAEQFGFKVLTEESENTFNKAAWKTVKAKSIAEKNLELPIQFYSEHKFFSARLYVRVDRLTRRIAKELELPLPKTLASLPPNTDYEDLSKAGGQGRYNETGRCLNGVMRRP